MLGFRGASRYVDEEFKPCFELECRALRRVRNRMGLMNVQVMVPFVRTLAEAQQVVELLAQNGLTRGEDGLKLIHDVRIARQCVARRPLLEFFDGMSIGSNDMSNSRWGWTGIPERSPRCSMSGTSPSSACWRWPSAPAGHRTSTWAFAGRGRPITRTSRCGCWTGA